MSATASRPRTRPVRTHLLALALGAILPTALFGAFVALRLAGEQQAATERRLVERARGLGQALDAHFEADVLALRTLALAQELERGELPAFRERARWLDESRPDWLGIALFAVGPRRVLDTREGELRAIRQPELVARVIEEGAPAVGDFLKDSTGPASYAICVRVAVRRTPHALCTVASSASLARLVDPAALSPDEATRTIVDARGTVVARSREAARFVGNPASAVFLAHTANRGGGVFRSALVDTGEPSYVAFSRSSVSGWSTSVVAPLANVTGPVRRSLALLVGVGLGLLGLGVLSAWLLSHRFTRALASAGEAADALAVGVRRDVRAFGIAEVDHLGDSLARSADLLEQRDRTVDEHIARADAARAQAESASRAKDEFLAMLGHELRNPLSPIVTALRLLRQRGQPWTREHQVVERQVEHLVRLVDDLLDVSRVTRGKVELAFRRLALAEPVHRAVEMASPLLEQRNHRLSLEVPSDLHVRADPVRLAQVVSNLLTNAARYTPQGGHVRVRAARQGDAVALEVSDDGQGIDAELLPRVFDLFMQGPRTADRSEGGLGIGLALVRSLVLAHGGQVEAESPGPGRGSTFRILLPEARAEEAAALPAPTPAPRPLPIRGALRILVVDDNVDAAHLLREFFERAGHEVRVAHDAPGALAAIEEVAPDVAVLDIGLPVVDGYELAERLRARLQGNAPGFVGVTGYGQASDRARSEAAGFAHHFVKPADPQALLAAIEALGRAREAGRARRPGERAAGAPFDGAGAENVLSKDRDFANPRKVR